MRNGADETPGASACGKYQGDTLVCYPFQEPCNGGSFSCMVAGDDYEGEGVPPPCVDAKKKKCAPVPPRFRHPRLLNTPPRLPNRPCPAQVLQEAGEEEQVRQEESDEEVQEVLRLVLSAARSKRAQ